MNTLEINNLDKKHYALTPSLAGAYFEAACTCLSRHHVPPQEFELTDSGIAKKLTLNWDLPTDRVKAAHNNFIDATEIGAYPIAIAAIENARNLYTVRRAETLTGADYYVSDSPESPSDLESCYRLEVSGTDGETAIVKTRLKQKLEQTRNGKSNLPAIAAIVGYSARLILIQTAE